MKYIFIIFAFAAFAVPALASAPPTHPGAKRSFGQASLRTTLCSAPKTLRTRNEVPADAHVFANGVAVNGKWLTNYRLTSPMTAQFYGRGIIAGLSITHKRGPAYLKLASIRHDCARVWFVIRWR
jgi:hypothetical protein